MNGDKNVTRIEKQVPAGRDWLVDFGLIAAGLAAIAASYSALKGLAHITGWGRLDWLLWVAIDIYALTATRVWLSSRTKSQKVRRFAAYNSVGAIGLSLAGNAAYHAIHAHAWNLGGHFWMLVVAVSSVPPVIIGLIGHLAVLRTRDADFAAQESVGANTAGATALRGHHGMGATTSEGHKTAGGHKPAGANEGANVAGPQPALNAGANTGEPREPAPVVTPQPVAPPVVAPPVPGRLVAPGGGPANANQVAPPAGDSTVVEFAPRGEAQTKMRAHWDAEIAGGRIPSGADLNRAASKDPKYSLGKKYARTWRQELPEAFVEAVEAGRTEEARKLAADFSGTDREAVAQ